MRNSSIQQFKESASLSMARSTKHSNSKQNRLGSGNSPNLLDFLQNTTEEKKYSPLANHLDSKHLQKQSKISFLI